MATSDSGGPTVSTEASTYDPSKDPTRKAKSKDPGWKYGYWPDLNDKNLVRCTLCGKDAKGGIKRLKQHLIGGYGDISKCPKTTAAIAREMHEAIMRNQKRKPDVFDEDYSVDHQQGEDLAEEIESGGQLQSASKRNKANVITPTVVKSPIDSYLRRTPKEIVGERRSKGSIQTTIQSSLRSNADKKKTNAYVAKWFYEAGIPFNTVKLRSFEEMVEAIAQFGSGYKHPSYHELRVPLLQDEKAQIDCIKKKYEDYWKRYGCTLMSDGWTDKRNMLFQLLDSKIEEIGEDNVVQVATDNAANYVAAGRMLMQKRNKLCWTPCVAHCLDLMLEDIGKLKAYITIKRAKTMTSFIYRHYKLVDALRKKTNGIDLVRSGVTRFATSFLTLQSLYKNKDALKQLFVSDHWNSSKLSKTESLGGKHMDLRPLHFNNMQYAYYAFVAPLPVVSSIGAHLILRAQGSTSAANICYTRRGRGRATVEESSDDEVEEEVHDVVRDDEDIEEDFGDGPIDTMSQQQQEGEEVDVDLLA
ncbi:uncharacterized protein LOC122068842 [Macadamia integrifolia]|uniref:uncharacterized protein LOC122068842 n=1 Tax=Macadamia integrifolia TaxID=60698 RepID=UPI001C4E7359|nr:uncharacterized protein LOC122068842 [Macadamia integrifolia]